MKRKAMLKKQRYLGLALIMTNLMLSALILHTGENDFTAVLLTAPIGLALLLSKKVIITD